MAVKKKSRVISPKPIFTNTNEIGSDEDVRYNPLETTIYNSDDLEQTSSCLDNLCIISHFCTLSSLDEYVSFLRDHLN